MNEAQAEDQLRGSLDESLLIYINEQGGQVSRTDADSFTEDERATAESVATLRQMGLVNKDPSLAAEMTLTAFGERTARRIRQSMLSGQRRADAVQRAVLRWLDNSTSEPVGIGEFVGHENAASSGVEFSLDEINHAAELLKDRGYMSYIAAHGSEYLRPSITSDGRAALLSDVLISEYGKPQATSISNDYSSKITFRDQAVVGGVISGGQGNTQYVNQVMNQASISAKVAELIDLVDGLPEDAPGRAELQPSLIEIQSEAAKSQSRGEIIKDLVLKAVGVATVVVGAEGGHQILKGLTELAQLVS